MQNVGELIAYVQATVTHIDKSLTAIEVAWAWSNGVGYTLSFKLASSDFSALVPMSIVASNTDIDTEEHLSSWKVCVLNDLSSRILPMLKKYNGPQSGEGGKSYTVSQYGQQYGRAMRIIPPHTMDTAKPGLHFVDKEQGENYYRTASRAVVDDIDREEEDFSYTTYAQAWMDNLAYDFVLGPLFAQPPLPRKRRVPMVERGGKAVFREGSATKGYTKRGKRVETGLRILALISVAGISVGTFAVWVLIYAST